MLYFRSEDHVDRWRRQWKLERGAVLTLDQVWRLAQAWYAADRSELSWRRFTLEEAEASLTRIGLTAPFWSLR